MSHSNTVRMIEYWSTLKGEEVAPPRASLNPADFSDILTQSFMIGRARPGEYQFRLAGALLEDLHRRPLRGSDFSALWTVGDRSKLQTAVEAALRRGEALLIETLGRSLQGREAKLEIMLAPFRGPLGKVDRLLGLYQPVSPLFLLQNQPIERLFLQEIAFASAGETVAAPVRIAAVDGRRIA
jgi:hypothetical protein